MTTAQQPSSITQSQRLYIIEMLFIFLPVTLFTAVMFSPFVINSIKALTKAPLAPKIILAAWPLLVPAIFISAWYLSYIFIKTGTKGLKQANLMPLLFCWLGAAWVIAATFSTFLLKENLLATLFLFGTPALIPFTHLVYERHFKQVGKQEHKEWNLT